MRTNKEVIKIKKSIKRWEKKRNKKIGLSYLTAGFGFRIDEAEYKKWGKINPNIEQINLYFGIDNNNKMVFYLVDSITDKLGKNNNLSAYKIEENVFIKNFEDSSSINHNTIESIPNILFRNRNDPSPKQVLSRILSWQLYSKIWFDYQRKSKFYQKIEGGDGSNDFYAGVAKCMTIPFSDLKGLFSSKPSPKWVFVFFGLRKNTLAENPLEKDILELILCNDGAHKPDDDSDGNQHGMEYLADVTMPRPPFSADSGYNLF